MTTEKNHMWLKEIATSFGMSVIKFAEVVGYSRQTLYCASYGNCKLSKGHLGLAVFKLITLSNKILENDIQYAKECHEYRRKLIDDFAKRFGVEDE
jgi:hypothetical protein